MKKNIFSLLVFLISAFCYAETPKATISGLLPEALGINVVSRDYKQLSVNFL